VFIGVVLGLEIDFLKSGFNRWEPGTFYGFFGRLDGRHSKLWGAKLFLVAEVSVARWWVMVAGGIVEGLGREVWQISLRIRGRTVGFKMGFDERLWVELVSLFHFENFRIGLSALQVLF